MVSNKLTMEYIFYIFVIMVIILEILVYFRNILPSGYMDSVYTILTSFMTMSILIIITKYNDIILKSNITNFKELYLIIHSIFLILPLSILLYIHAKYHGEIQKVKPENIPQYDLYINISTTFLILQSILSLGTILNFNYTTFGMNIILSSIISIISGLLWRNLTYYTTDG